MMLVKCSWEEDNVTEEVDSAAGNWGIGEEETEFCLDIFEIPVVPICFPDSVKKRYFFSVICSLATEIPAIRRAINISSLYIFSIN